MDNNCRNAKIRVIRVKFERRLNFLHRIKYIIGNHDHLSSNFYPINFVPRDYYDNIVLSLRIIFNI